MNVPRKRRFPMRPRRPYARGGVVPRTGALYGVTDPCVTSVGLAAWKSAAGQRPEVEHRYVGTFTVTPAPYVSQAAWARMEQTIREFRRRKEEEDES